MKRIKNDEYAVRLYNLYAGGLIVFSLIVLQDFMTLKLLDRPAFISVVAFAIALPLLSGMLVINTVESKYQYGPSHSMIARLTESLFALGVLAALTGIDAAFWHIFWIAGVLFWSMLIIAAIVYSLYIWQLKESAEELEEETVKSLQDIANSSSALNQRS